MAYLLNCVYLLLVASLSPWLVYRSLATGRYRQGWAQKLLGRVPRRTSTRRAIWLHAVSVGEVNLLGTIIQEIQRRWPDVECVISTTTATGYQLAQSRYRAHTVFYCPLDFSWATAAAMRRVRPDLLVLAELELWPNLIRAARAQGARVAIVNGRLSDKSHRGYRRVRLFTAWLLRQVHLVAAQNAQYAERFRSLGVPAERVQVTGSMKYDGAETDRQNPATQRLARLARIAPDDAVFLAGSTQDPEERLALATYRALADELPHLRLIIVPRHPERFEEVAALLAESGMAYERRSQLESLPADRPAARVLLIDAVGELRAWWGTAQVAFVGGSLSTRGGQNMIEPAAYGAAVSFGPNTRNFRDVVAALLEDRAAQVVHDQAEMQAFVRRAVREPAFAAELGQRARAQVLASQGATRRTVDLLAPLLLDEPVAARLAPARPHAARVEHTSNARS